MAKTIAQIEAELEELQIELDSLWEYFNMTNPIALSQWMRIQAGYGEEE